MRRDRPEVDEAAPKSREARADDAAVEAATVALGYLLGACMAFSMTAMRRLWPWELFRIKDEKVKIAASLVVALARILYRWPETNRALKVNSDELIAAVTAPERELQMSFRPRAYRSSTRAGCG